MKFMVAILCACIVQMCSGSEKFTDEMRIELKQQLRDDINGAGEQFIDDFIFIREKVQDNNFARVALCDSLLIVLSKEIPKEKDARLDVKRMIEFRRHFNEKCASIPYATARYIDYMKVFESILSKNVSPERYNNIINLLFVIGYPNVTAEETQNALNYLHGTEPVEMKTALFNISHPTSADCPDFFKRYSEAIDKIKSMIDIKQKVIEDATAIRDKFPCNHFGLKFLEFFVDAMTGLRGEQTKINACMVENHAMIIDNFDLLKDVFPTRLSDETFRGIMNFFEAFKLSDTSTDQIQKALEYLYVDVPTTQCE